MMAGVGGWRRVVCSAAGVVELLQLRLPSRHPDPRDDQALRGVVEEVRVKVPGLLSAMDPAKGPGKRHQTPTLDC
jgi:hypothetical protein